MVFRTGSILIVGKCDDNIIIKVYNFLKTILHDEYLNICENYDIVQKPKEKKIKSRKKTIYVDNHSEYIVQLN